MNNRAEREVAVFNAALELPAHERAGYLEQACAGDQALRTRVEAMLEVHLGAGDFMESPVLGSDLSSAAKAATVQNPLPPSAASPSIEKAGDRIGRYKLLEQIGEGGCGVVYMAEQEEPVRRKVALKLIKLGMDTRTVVARFEAERQALALMDHPNIARVLDAGATEGGRPYFIMELVRGVRITEHCDQHELDTRERLELFIQVCQAVQHAHQKGIIHRDLKPSNILVTVNDGVPVPKVIDFGIAKATQGRLTDKTVFTAFQQFIGTPAYMSPEQAEMTSLDIDTRSDIYSLGVLLYELLTGQTPFDTNALLAAGLDAMRRTIREQEPARPSTRLTTMLRADLTAVARRRHTDAPKLIHTLRGDLDCIVMKTLEKDRKRRYDTANGLAQDVRRFLLHEPITAAAPGPGYKLRKFMRRHQAGVAAAAFMLLLALAGVAGTTWGMIQAKRQASIARHTTDFLTGMFERIDPANAKLREITVREVLDDSARTIGTAFPDEPLTERPIRKTIGEIYSKLGHDELALPQAEAALRLAKAAHGEKDHPDTAEGLQQLGLCLTALGRTREALPPLESALAMRQRIYKGDQPDVAASLDDLAACLNALGRSAEALPTYESSLAMLRRLHQGDDPQVAISLNNVGLCLDALHRWPEALPKYVAGLEMLQRIHKGDHLDVARGLNNLSHCLNELGRPSEALTNLQAALAMKQRIYKGDHPEVAKALNNVGVSLRTVNRPADALPILQAGLEMNQRVYPSPHPEIANSLNNVASTLNALGRSSDALPKYEAALEMKQQLFTGDHAQVAVALHNVAFCLNALGRTAEALPKEEASLEMYQRLFHGDDVAVSGGLNNVASWLNLLGRSAEALPKFQQALEMSQRLAEAQPGNNALKMNVALTHGNLGDLLAKTGNAEGSREQYQQGLQIAEAILASDAANARAAKVRTGLRAKLGFEPSTNSAGSPK